MKSWIIVICLIIVTALMLSGCATTSAPVLPAAKEVAVSYTYDEFMAQKNITKDIEVKIGEKIVVTLPSNSASTGFSWDQKAEISDPQVLEQTKHETVAPADTKMVGAPGADVFTFRSLELGFSKVLLKYSRPWEGGEKGEWTFTLNVTVK
ncbi:MAG: protease inhibitor I42 family protein [Dehalococcoidia bacterium]|nr:protease inhibitor I42 family protein [Dehalococcoidia bacterium]MDD5495125.1 protease inhibitor I42 family protein [Dehalococcoidia bacterium]